VINAIKFAIEEIEASDQYFDHTRAAEKITLWDSWLRRDSLKAIGRAFG
jgi:hypothetical protein